MTQEGKRTSTIYSIIKHIPIPILLLILLQFAIYPQLFTWAIIISCIAGATFIALRIRKFRKEQRLAKLAEKGKYAIEIHAPVNGMIIGDDADVHQHYHHP